MEKVERFRIDIPHKEIDIETAKFLFDQAEKLLTSTVETGGILTDRALGLLRFEIPALAALVGYLATTKNSNDLAFQIGLYLSIVLLICTFLSAMMYWVTPVMDKGSQPKLLAIKELFKYNEDEQVLTFIVNEIESYQLRISHNMSYNKKRVQWFKLTIGTLIFGLLSILGYLVVVNQ